MSCWHNAGVGSLDGRTASFSIAVRTSRAENENCTSPYETQRPRAEFSWDGCLEAKRGAAGAHTAARWGTARVGCWLGRPWRCVGERQPTLPHCPQCPHYCPHCPHSSRRTLSRVAATRKSRNQSNLITERTKIRFGPDNAGAQPPQRTHVTTVQ